MRLRKFWIENHKKQLRNFLSPPNVTNTYLLVEAIGNVTYDTKLEQEGEAIRQRWIKKQDQCKQREIGLLIDYYPEINK